MSELVSVETASVLVVEDDAGLRTLFIALLTRQGFEVECANDGAQALERLALRRYSVVLLDLMMPVVNGFDLLHRFAESRPSLLRRTVVATGVSERDLQKLDHSSVFAVLRKPFDIDRLVSTVKECARQSPPGGRRNENKTLSRSIRKFESVLPELGKLLAPPASSEHELLLREQLRRVVGDVAGVLAEAASAAPNATRAARCEELRHAASRLAAGTPPRARLDH